MADGVRVGPEYIASFLAAPLNRRLHYGCAMPPQILPELNTADDNPEPMLQKLFVEDWVSYKKPSSDKLVPTWNVCSALHHLLLPVVPTGLNAFKDFPTDDFSQENVLVLVSDAGPTMFSAWLALCDQDVHALWFAGQIHAESKTLVK